MHTQYVVLEWHNGPTVVEKLRSHNKITLDRVVKYYEENEDFNSERDSLTLIDKITTISMD
ncbi:MAG: hypothetical protein WC341_17000 [Bacteroidales bacterium]|jgi:hypothetical protein